MHTDTVRPFRVSHLWGLNWRDATAFQLLGETGRRLYEESPGFSGFCGDTFVGAAGIVRMSPWLGEAWAIAGPLVMSHKLWFHKAVKGGILNMAQALGLRRVQCVVQADFRTGRDWVERLGFWPEALLRNYGPAGESVWLYVMFPEG